jgi:TonB-dependent starch-binding outer membrane protein SusC
MEFKPISKKGLCLRRPPLKTLLAMKWTIFLVCAFLQSSGNGYSQLISITFKNAPLEKVFSEIEKQSGYTLWYEKDFFRGLKKIDIDVKGFSLEKALDLTIKDQPLSYSIVGKMVVIKQKQVLKSADPIGIDLKGRVINEKGEPMIRASVIIKGTTKGLSTDENGFFELKEVDAGATIVVSFAGYESQQIKINSKNNITVVLVPSVSSLDQTLVIAYGTTTRRLNTGSVGKLTSQEIEEQPVANPLAALEGRIPGLVVTQTSGIAGSGFSVQLRGQNSIAQGNDPLFIIDGVPYAANNSPINQVNSAAIPLNSTAGSSVGLSPFNSINPGDIESIEVLKDADATSIYGSRGANGVILITTKKGKAGKTKFTANVYTGASTVTRTMDMLNTPQYLAMRHEAFLNDKVTETVSNAPDLLVWDTTRYTDFTKLLIGGTAMTTDAQAAVSGGTNNTQFLVGASYHRETTVFPGDFSDGRGGMHFNLNHASQDHKFSMTLSSSFISDKNQLNSTDLTYYTKLPPNLPPLYDSANNLNWSKNGFSFTNPLAYLQQKYTAQTDNLLSSLKLGYMILPGLTASANLGYNMIQVSEVNTNPSTSQNPQFNPEGYSTFSNGAFKSFIIEPQLEYRKNIKEGKLDVLVGSTWQQNTSSNDYIYAYGYTSDALLQSLAAAGGVYPTNNYAQYRYAAFFGRVNYNWNDRYIVNISGRRDGSSRFGPGRQYADFGSAGLGWIFSNEAFMKDNLHWLSFGKLRTSYGTSGNDKIGDYQYLDNWSITSAPYEGTTGFYPTGLYNPNYGWEVNRKFEAAAELGFFKDRVFVTAAWFQNRSSNQLIAYQLPSQTGFTSVNENFPALVQNSGIEIDFSWNVIKTAKFSWKTFFNISIPRNKLLSFPNLTNSSYSYLVIGQPLNIVNGFRSLGVNPSTGVYQFADSAGKAIQTPTYPQDYVHDLLNLNQKYYGGFRNSFGYKQWQLDVFFEYRDQMGRNYLYNLIATPPGTENNQPTLVLDRWQNAGDQTGIQKFTTTRSSDAYKAAQTARIYGSDLLYSDASFIRLKNLSFSYNFSGAWMKKMKLENCRLYIQGQNLITITGYKGSDPETQNLYALPPLKTYTAGIQFSF